jgi:hypothetical protein
MIAGSRQLWRCPLTVSIGSNKFVFKLASVNPHGQSLIHTV